MPTSREDVAHLLRRAGFGGLPAEIDALTPLSLPAVVDAILDLSQAPGVVMPDLTTTTDEYQRWLMVNTWWIERMRTTIAPIQERMTLFWHNHFPSSRSKVGSVQLLADQNQLFRALGMGRFRDLVQAVALDPAMIWYLDNNKNVKGAPNENFARELMELFTLGVNQYTQDDVVASAKAWTGHSFTGSNGNYAYVFNASRHDTTDKTFFGKTQNWDGPQIIDEIMTSKRDVVARFIAAKVWSFFAYPEPEDALVTDLAAAFAAADLDITVLLRTMCNRPEFYSAKAKGALIRTPTEFVVAALRYSGISASTANPEWYMPGMGQQLLYPPGVDGWHQNEYWVSATSTWSRAGFARNLTWKARDAGVLAGVDTMAIPDAVQLAFDQFGITEPAAETRQWLETWMAGERATKGWAQQPNLITLTLLSPDFQLA